LNLEGRNLSLLLVVRQTAIAPDFRRRCAELGIDIFVVGRFLLASEEDRSWPAGFIVPFRYFVPNCSLPARLLLRVDLSASLAFRNRRL
jgi:hypothetical protein